MKHAICSPSSAYRWIPCPASIAGIEEATGGVEKEPSSYAHEGTVCHDVASDCLKKKIDPASFLGEVVDEVLMTQDLIDCISTYVDDVRGMTQEFKVTGGVIEYGVKITEDCWGTLDAGLWNPELLIVTDLKTGKGVYVEVKDNPQLMIYALGMLRFLFEEHKLSPEKVILKIVQPRMVNPIRTFEITRTELMEWGKTVLMPAIARTKEPIADYSPGEDQCRWCDAKPCAAQANQALHLAEQAFAPFTEHKMPEVGPETQEGLLSLESVSKLLPSFKFISNWIGDMEAYAFAQALDGETVPGYKLVEGRSNRQWKVDDVKVKAFLASKAPDADPMGEPKLLSPTQMEKLLGKKVADAIDLKGYIYKPPGAKTLVPESDKREAVDLNVEEEFEQFAETATGGSQVEDVTDKPLSSALADLAPIGAVIREELATTIIIADESTGPVVASAAFAALMDSDDIEDDEDQFEMIDIEALTTEDMFHEKMAEMGTDKDSLLGESGESSDTLPESLQGMFDSLEEEPKAVMADKHIQVQAVPTPPAAPPKNAPQRMNILNMGKGGTTLDQVAKSLTISVNQVKMQLRYLNERDGYGYILYTDGSFEVYE